MKPTSATLACCAALTLLAGSAAAQQDRKTDAKPAPKQPETPKAPKADKPQMRASYIAGLFRAMRFGDTEAHGRGAAMQYRYIRDKGGLEWDAKAERFRINPAKLDAAIAALTADIVRLQGDGNYAGAKAFFDKWGKMDAEAKAVTAKMGHIPVDIWPLYPAKI